MKAIDLFFAARPMLHLPVWSIYLVSLSYHHRPSGSLQLEHFLPLVALSLLVSGAYFINQLFDVEGDRFNRKLGFIGMGILSTKDFVVAYVVTSTLAIAVSLTFSTWVLVFFLWLFFLGYFYSAPPLKLKDRPMLGFIANAIAYGAAIPLFVWPELNVHNGGLVRFDLSVYFFAAVGAIYLLTTVADIDGDRATGKRTAAVILGRKPTQIMAVLLLAGATSVAFWSGTLMLTIIGAISTAVTLFALTDGSERLNLLATKLPILLLTLLASFHYPLYFLFLVALFLLCRIYYARRFSIVYPNLT